MVAQQARNGWVSMTKILITIDTEYDFGFTRRNGVASRCENFIRSIACRTPSGAVGTDYQMDVLDRHGMKAVFFVDPMPALVWGTAAIEDVVGPIVARGHDVQLHIHTEWLELAGGANPLGARTGTSIKDFSFEEQGVLLDYARATLVAAGGSAPVAFRAGNYGANDDTLRALAHLGIAFDTSHCPGIAGSLCDISLTAQDRAPMQHCGVIEVPVGCIAAPGGGLRHAQLTALSAGKFWRHSPMRRSMMWPISRWFRTVSNCSAGTGRGSIGSSSAGSNDCAPRWGHAKSPVEPTVSILLPQGSARCRCCRIIRCAWAGGWQSRRSPTRFMVRDEHRYRPRQIRHRVAQAAGGATRA
jgi:hypothetical protein